MIRHSLPSLDNAAAGPTYSVPALAAAQSCLGAIVELHTLGDAGRDVHGVHVIWHQPTLQRVPMIRRLGWSTAMYRDYARTEAAVIHSHGLWMFPNVYRWREASRSGRLFVISPRGMLSPVALSFSVVPKRLFSWLAQDAALASASMLHATSMEELADIRVYGLTQPVALLPNGIDVQPMDRLHSGPRRRTILSLGRIHPKKGLVTLIESWASLEADFPDWDLRIVGPDERGHKAELRDHCRRIGLKRVRIEEPVFGEEKTRLMSSVSLFALPTRSENFAMTVAESLAAGTPVISSKGAPWHGLETNRCGWWVDHGAASFSAALRRAMSLPEAELQAMGLRGREWMERDFSWNRIAAAMLEAYDWGLNGGPIPAHVHVG